MLHVMYMHVSLHHTRVQYLTKVTYIIPTFSFVAFPENFVLTHETHEGVVAIYCTLERVYNAHMQGKESHEFLCTSKSFNIPRG